jgi:probable HAF family extracellular repeat protein
MRAFSPTALAFVAALHAPGTADAASSFALAPPPISYEQVVIGTLGGATSQGSRIDNHGRVFGLSATAGGATHAFLWADGVLTDLDLVPADLTIDANERGEVVLQGRYQGGAATAYLWSRGSIVALGMDRVSAINDRGEVAGWAGTFLPRLWSDGSTVELEQPGTYASPRGLNNRGDVVGEMGVPGGFAVHAIRWRHDGTTETAVLPGTNQCSAGAINGRGQAVGFCYTPDGNSALAFLWDDEGISDLAFGSTNAEATHINDRGQIAGFVSVAGSFRAVFWEDGVSTLIEPPLGGTETFPIDLNERGQVLGAVTTPGAARRLFLWESGVMTDLGPGNANDINDRGEVTGRNASSVAVVWRPAKPAAGDAPLRSGAALALADRRASDVPSLRITSATGSVPVEFRLQGTGAATYAGSIIDIHGRMIARLSGDATSGVIRWNGRTRQGAPAPPGVYFLSVRSERGEASAKILLLR